MKQSMVGGQAPSAKTLGEGSNLHESCARPYVLCTLRRAENTKIAQNPMLHYQSALKCLNSQGSLDYIGETARLTSLHRRQGRDSCSLRCQKHHYIQNTPPGVGRLSMASRCKRQEQESEEKKVASGIVAKTQECSRASRHKIQGLMQ